VSYDPIDVFGGAFGSVIKQSLLFAATVWGGSLVGGTAIFCGTLIGGGHPGAGLWLIYLSPLLLLSLWGFLNFLILIIAFVYFLRAESLSRWAWIGLMGIESLIAVLGWRDLAGTGWLSQSIVWVAWVLFSGMAGAGIYNLWQWQTDRWAHHMFRVDAENAWKREELRVRLEEQTRASAAVAQGAQGFSLSGTGPAIRGDDESEAPTLSSENR